MKATPVNAITITSSHRLYGETILETPCADFDAYRALPQVVSYNGIICGKTGWSSDRNYACYKSTASIAFVVPSVGK